MIKMDLTKHEKYQFIQTITENHLFRANNEPSENETWFANILAKTIIGSLKTCGKHPNLLR